MSGSYVCVNFYLFIFFHQHINSLDSTLLDISLSLEMRFWLDSYDTHGMNKGNPSYSHLLNTFFIYTYFKHYIWTSLISE